MSAEFRAIPGYIRDSTTQPTTTAGRDSSVQTSHFALAARPAPVGQINCNKESEALNTLDELLNRKSRPIKPATASLSNKSPLVRNTNPGQKNQPRTKEFRNKTHSEGLFPDERIHHCVSASRSMDQVYDLNHEDAIWATRPTI